MDQNLENKPNFKNKLIYLYDNHKKKIFILLLILVLILISLIFVQSKNEKKNILISEKYVKAGLYLAADKKDISKKMYEEIILSNNKFYSILALNTIIEKNLITDKNKIIEYFTLLEKSSASKDQEDLIMLKKALYKIKNSEIDNGEKLLKQLIDKNSILKPLAKELIE